MSKSFDELVRESRELCARSAALRAESARLRRQTDRLFRIALGCSVVSLVASLVVVALKAIG
jgi:hypothetical protein